MEIPREGPGSGSSSTPTSTPISMLNKNSSNGNYYLDNNSNHSHHSKNDNNNNNNNSINSSSNSNSSTQRQQQQQQQRAPSLVARNKHPSISTLETTLGLQRERERAVAASGISSQVPRYHSNHKWIAIAYNHLEELGTWYGADMLVGDTRWQYGMLEARWFVSDDSMIG